MSHGPIANRRFVIGSLTPTAEAIRVALDPNECPRTWWNRPGAGAGGLSSDAARRLSASQPVRTEPPSAEEEVRMSATKLTRQAVTA